MKSHTIFAVLYMKDNFQQLYDTNDGTAIPSYSAIHHLANDKASNANLSHASALLNSDAAWGLRYMTDLSLSVTNETQTSITETSSNVVEELDKESVVKTGLEPEPNKVSEIITTYLDDKPEIGTAIDLLDEIKQKPTSPEIIGVLSNVELEHYNHDDIEVGTELAKENVSSQVELIQTTGGDSALEQHISTQTVGMTENNTIAPIHSKEIETKKAKKSKKFKLVDHSGISAYHQWLLSLKDADFEQRIQKQEEKAKQKRIEAEARKSVTKSDDIISESLADILASQGHIEHAKKMYAQLMQKYPQKSSYFASKIDNI